MRFSFVWLLLFNSSAVVRPSSDRIIERPDLSRFFAAEQLTGSFLLYDSARSEYTAYRPDRCRQGFLPASTFKILNTLIGLETGVIPDSSYVIKWDGKPHSIAAWNRDHTLASAFRVSCVPYYRELARRVGVWQMRHYVRRVRYGRTDIRAGNLDRFWLTGRSRISQWQQIDLLRRTRAGNVPFSERNRVILKSLMLLDEKPAYRLYGKTGWVSSFEGLRPEGPEIGWFVGYVETKGNVYFFATNVESPAPVPDQFVPGRRRITEAILHGLSVL